MLIGIPVYDEVDLMDVTAPYEIFKWASDLTNGTPTVDVKIVGETDTVASRDGLKFSTQGRFDKIGQLDVIWVPGGNPGALAPMMNGTKPTYVSFLRAQATKAHVIASVCEGALLLAAAGLLDGFQATTHWSFIPCLKKFRNVKVVEGHPRFVVDGNRITGGGISSGLDEALKLVEILTSRAVAEGVQQMIQYYPDPPVASTIPQVTDCPFRWETA
jgi:transcriptional regulator GlxA family with amidase domain